MWPCCRVAQGVGRLCYHVNPPSRGTADLRCHRDSKRGTWPGHGELIRLTVLPWERGCIALSQVWLTAEEGQFKDIYTARLKILFVLGNKLSVSAITSRSPTFFSVHKFTATAAERGRRVGREMVKQKCQFRAG